MIRKIATLTLIASSCTTIFANGSTDNLKLIRKKFSAASNEIAHITINHVKCVAFEAENGHTYHASISMAKFGEFNKLTIHYRGSTTKLVSEDNIFKAGDSSSDYTYTMRQATNGTIIIESAYLNEYFPGTPAIADSKLRAETYFYCASGR